jgi:hypothetical protein
LGCKKVPGGGGSWDCWPEFGVAAVPESPRRALISSLHIGWPLPPLLELSTSDTPESAGDGGNEPENRNCDIMRKKYQNI